MYNFPLSVTLRAALTMSQSLQSYTPRPTCYRPRRVLLAIVLAASSVLIAIHLIVVMLIASCSSRRDHRVVLNASCSSCRAQRVVLIASCSLRRPHRVVLITSCSSRRAQRVMSYLPTFICFRVKCGSSIYRCILDRMNRTGLSHYAWNPLRVCECDKSICYDVPYLNR